MARAIVRTWVVCCLAPYAILINKRIMNQSKRAQLFTVAFFVSLPLAVVAAYWFPIEKQKAPLAVVIPLAVFGFSAQWGFRCKNCHESIFMRRGRSFDYSIPWPTRQCCSCGARFDT